MQSKFQVNAPSLFTRAPSWRQVNQLAFPAILHIYRFKFGINFFIPELLSKISLRHDSATIAFFFSKTLRRIKMFWIFNRFASLILIWKIKTRVAARSKKLYRICWIKFIFSFCLVRFWGFLAYHSLEIKQKSG